MTNTNNNALDDERRAAYHVLTKMGATELVVLESADATTQFLSESTTGPNDEAVHPVQKHMWRNMTCLALALSDGSYIVGFTGPLASLAGDILYEAGEIWERLADGPSARSLVGRTVTGYSGIDAQFIINNLSDRYTSDDDRFKRSVFQFSDYEDDVDCEVAIISYENDKLILLLHVKDDQDLREVVEKTHAERQDAALRQVFVHDMIATNWQYFTQVTSRDRVKWLHGRLSYETYDSGYATYSHTSDDGIISKFKVLFTDDKGNGEYAHAYLAFASAVERASIDGALASRFGDGTPVAAMLTGKEVAWFFDYACQADQLDSKLPHDMWIFTRGGESLHVKMTDYNVNWIKLDCINKTNRTNLLKWFAEDQAANERKELIAAFDRGELQPSTMPASEAIVRKADVDYKEMFAEQFPQEVVEPRKNWPTALTSDVFEKAEVPLKVVDDTVKIVLKDILRESNDIAYMGVTTTIKVGGRDYVAPMYKLTDPRVRGMLPAKAFYSSHQYHDQYCASVFSEQLLMTFYVNNGLAKTALDNSQPYVLLIQQKVGEEVEYDKRALVFIDNQVAKHGELLNIFVFGHDSLEFLIQPDQLQRARQL